jgi:hypothetical protein
MALTQHFEASGVGRLVVEAAAMSAESAPEQLVARFLRLCVEAASADTGALVLEEDGELFVRAVAPPGQEILVERRPLAGSTEVARALVEEVRRTGLRTQLGGAGADDASAAVSTLALPVRRDAKLVGVLTLEGGRFEPEAIQALERLCAHFASALERSELAARLMLEASERRRAEAGLRFIAEASTTLAETLDHEEALRRLVRLTVPFLADWCTIDLLDGEGVMRRVAAGQRDPELQTVLLDITTRKLCI